MVDPLEEFRQAERHRVVSDRSQEWPAVLRVGDSTAELTTEPAVIEVGEAPDRPPDVDDLDVIFAAWGLSRDEWELDAGTLRANVWPMAVGPGDVRLFRQWKATLRRVGSRADIAPILDGIRRMRPRRRRSPSAGRTRVLAVADPQMGKAGADGSAAVAGRWLAGVQGVLDAEQRARKLGYGTDRIIVALMGDLIESCSSSHQSQLFELDLHLTDQIRLVHECVWQTVKAVAPLWQQVDVAAVPGNHGEVRASKGQGLSTMPSDNFDVAIPDMVRRSIVELNPEPFEHVRWWMPHGEELVVVMPVDDVGVGMAHGHQFRGAGDPLLKAERWWANQLVNDSRSELASVQVLLVGHYHHLRVQRSGDRTLILCPSLEDREGSRWFTNATGAQCPPGMLSFVVDGQSPWPVRNLEEL